MPATARSCAAPSTWRPTSREADATGARRELVQQLTRVDLLVLEDFGMKKLGSNAAEDLLEVFVRRHETASTLITTNRPTQDWGVFLGDVPAATAILDRFLAHATIVQMTGQELSTAPAHRCEATTEAVDGAAAVDAQNAPTAAWKTRRRVSHTAHRRTRTVIRNRTKIPRLRAVRSQTILTPPTAWPLFKRSSVAAFERSVTRCGFSLLRA